jgi:transposase
VGGQEGHKGTKLQWVEKPDFTVTHKKEKCEGCLQALNDTMITGFESRQVSDIPIPKIEVTQHDVAVYCCSHCKKENKATFPVGINASAKTQYGERIKGVAVYLNTLQLIPTERCSDIMRDLFNAESLASSSIVTWVNEYAESVTASETGERILRKIEQSNVRHGDETGLRVAGTTQWLHVLSTSYLTHYRVSAKRGDICFNLNNKGGVIVHDHFKSYLKLDGVKHAYCNAHHLRELKALIEFERDKGNEGAVKMRDWLYLAYKTRKEAIQKGRLHLPRAVLKKLKQEYDTILQEWYVEHLLYRADNKEAGKQNRSDGHNLVRRLKEHRSGVIRFLDDFSIPFTNNQAEQDIRMMKVKMKISGGFRSPHGAENFALIRSVTSTARKQGINALTALSTPSHLLPSLLSV